MRGWLNSASYPAVSVKVSGLSSWHARAAALSYVQLAVFCNLFTLQSCDDVTQQLQQLVLRLLTDDQLEVTTTCSSSSCNITTTLGLKDEK